MHELEKQPPYPGGATGTQRLYEYLGELRLWVQDQRQILTAEAQRLIPGLTHLPREAYMQQPVMDQFRHFVFLRRVREMYDHLVRQHAGEEWTGDYCLRKRIALLQTVIEQLNECCRPFETREASFARDMERLQKVFQGLSAYVEEAVTPLGET